MSITVSYNEIALQHYNAMLEGVRIDPPSFTYPGFNEHDAYLVQREGLKFRLEKGAKIVGRKIGCTNKANQAAMKTDHPTSGFLLDDFVYDQDTPIDLSLKQQPFVEAELCFVMGETLTGPGVTKYDALRAISGVLPSFEIVAGRTLPEKKQVIDALADNGANSGFVIGDVIANPAGIDFSTIGVVMRRNGEILHASSGAAVLENPLNVIAWMANLAAEYGESLEKGSFIMTGSTTPAGAKVTPLSSGDLYEAVFQGVGSIRARFI